MNLHRRYRWESELMPEDVRERIRTLAKPIPEGWYNMDGDTFYREILDDTHFYLIRTGAWGPRGPCFCGTVAESEGKTVITGTIEKMPQIRKRLRLFWIGSAIMALLFIGLDFALVLFLLLCMLVNLLGFLIAPFFDRLFFGSQNQAVLDLIEHHLLKR